MGLLFVCVQLLCWSDCSLYGTAVCVYSCYVGVTAVCVGLLCVCVQLLCWSDCSLYGTAVCVCTVVMLE